MDRYAEEEGWWPCLGTDGLPDGRGQSRHLVNSQERRESRQPALPHSHPLPSQQVDREMKMQSYNFTLFFDGLDLEDDEALDKLFEAGCDDATFGMRDGAPFAEFDREAATFSEAVISAIREAETALDAIRVTRVEPDDLVPASVIAQRTGRTRQSVQQLISGKRGPGNFPAPAAWPDKRHRLWHWGAVAAWFAEADGRPLRLGGAPYFIGALNGTLQARSQMTALSRIAVEEGPENLQLSRESIVALVSLVEEGSELLERELATA